VWQTNKAHSTGRGLNGYTTMNASTKVSPNFIEQSLDIAVVDQLSIGGLQKPNNGTMTIEMRNENSGETSISTIDITLVGNNKTSLKDLADQLNQVPELSASIDIFGQMNISSSQGHTFYIKEDTSNTAAFLGLNSFFDGNDAATLNVREDLKSDATLLAAAQSDAPGDNSNIIAIINSKEETWADGKKFFEHYESFVNSVASEANRISSLRENQERILTDVVERRNSFSGVNLDEEAANMLRYQQAYQAAAQYISVQNQLINLLFQAV
jgi:flagellar hook-associated protein 1 FlgK